MPVVRMPDGVNVNFPNDMPPEQIKGLILQKFPDAGGPKAEKTFSDNVSDAYDKRAGQAQTAVDAYQAGQQSLPETFMQVTGKGVAGLANDVVGEGISAITPEPVKQVGRDVLNYVASTPVGDVARSAIQKYDSIAQEHPRAARNIESVANIGAAVGSLVSGEGAAVAAKSVGEISLSKAGTVVDAVANLIKDAAKFTKLGFQARDVEALQGVAQDIKASGSRAYQAMRDSGAVFKPEAGQGVINNIDTVLKDDGITNAGLHGKTLSVLNDLKAEATNGDLELEKLDQYRQLFGQVAGNRTPDNLQDARKASIVIDAIDKTVDGMKDTDLVNGSRDAIDALKLGRKEWQRSRKFEAITDIVNKADGDANYLKRELKKFAENPKKTRGWSPDEVSALNDAASLSGVEGVAKMLGKFGFDFGNSRIGSGVGALVGAGAGGASLGGAGAIIAPVVGTVARQGQKLIGRGKVEELLKVIENGGKVGMKDVGSLPPKEANMVLEAAKKKNSALKAAPLTVEVTPKDKR